MPVRAASTSPAATSSRSVPAAALGVEQAPNTPGDVSMKDRISQRPVPSRDPPEHFAGGEIVPRSVPGGRVYLSTPPRDRGQGFGHLSRAIVQPIRCAAVDERVGDEALDILYEASGWRLAANRWSEVERLLRRLTEALSAGDVAAFQQATHDLEAAGPRRAVRAEQAAAMAAQPPVRERISALIHALDDSRVRVVEAPDVPDAATAIAAPEREGDGRSSLRRRRWGWRRRGS
jgi:hypothetical protein